MGMTERQNEILRILCRRRHETISNLAAELGVSERTIRRDVEMLSLTEPLYTRSGRYDGGVYIMEGYSMNRMYFKDKETDAMRRVITTVEKSGEYRIDQSDLSVLKEMLAAYSRPTVKLKI